MILRIFQEMYDLVLPQSNNYHLANFTHNAAFYKRNCFIQFVLYVAFIQQVNQQTTPISNLILPTLQLKYKQVN